jgi:aspartyl-tRNA(Asn)/glutamyl-tRNA(Gln) amidotransferase subunit B
VRYLGISDGNMQEGSFRCDANVSVRPKGQKEFGTRAELKNINSFKFVEKAINFEVERQIDLIETGGTVVQETRLYDPDKHETRSMRSKEEAMDYRYFPDPDLLPVAINDDDINAIQATLPELPTAKKARFEKDLGLSTYDAGILTSDRELADYFEAVVKASGEAKLSANWVISELAGRLNKEDKTISESPISAAMLGGMIKRLAENAITSKMAKDVFNAMWDGEGDADSIIEKRGLKPADAGEVEKIIDDIIAANPEQVEQFRAGKDKVLGFFVGQIMKASKGKADPAQVNQLLREKLK